MTFNFKVLKDRLRHFLDGVKIKIGVNFFGIITIDVEKLLTLEKQAQSGSILKEEGGARTAKPPEIGRADLSARDNILENWAQLKQIIKDVALAQKMPVMPKDQTVEIVQNLVNAGKLQKVLSTLIIVLYEEGKRIADRPGKKVYEGQAAVYQRLVNSVSKWLDKLLVPPPPPIPSPKPPRHTQVGGYFPPPTPGRPGAILIGVSGPLQGRQFAMDKEIFRIGAGSDNDLIIAGDSYVSENHAYLRYEKGSLWLADQHSLNGTFLNENRLKDAPLILNLGDQIRVGTSTFKVIQTPGR